MTAGPADEGSAALARELRNFQEIARRLIPEPGELPRLQGIDVWGDILPLNDAVGGDHLIYVDFKQRYDLEARLAHARGQGDARVVDGLQRCRQRAGIVVMDVSGHQTTDALLAAMTHQAFLLGALYELDRYGQITTRLFENLNTRLYNSSGTHKFVSLLYGEVSEEGTFRFLSAGQPFPRVFSYRENRFMEVGREHRISFPPLGIQPSFDVIDRSTTRTFIGFKEAYHINEWTLLGAGDLLLLFTDGVTEHGEHRYMPDRLEACLRAVKDETARKIQQAVIADMAAFAPPKDDITLVVVKRL